MNITSHPESDLLVIGYGNTLRQDDQAGPLVAELIEVRALPWVRTLVCAQLSPEHAELVSQVGAVVFVDAQAGLGGETILQEILPGESVQVTTHAAEPRAVLALARDIYGRAPPAWLLTIPAEKFGFGEDLSPVTRRALTGAVAKVAALARRNRDDALAWTNPFR
jgi:hydrogenase maturation protease